MTSDEAVALAETLVAQGLVPRKAAADALHVAHAAVNAITWNCTHIANAQLREKIAHACRVAGRMQIRSRVVLFRCVASPETTARSAKRNRSTGEHAQQRDRATSADEVQTRS